MRSIRATRIAAWRHIDAETTAAVTLAPLVAESLLAVVAARAAARRVAAHGGPGPPRSRRSQWWWPPTPSSRRSRSWPPALAVAVALAPLAIRPALFQRETICCAEREPVHPRRPARDVRDHVPRLKLVIEKSYSSKTRKVKATRTDNPHEMPVHPTLARVLAEWKLSGFERFTGRAPRSEDHLKLIISTLMLSEVLARRQRMAPRD